MNKISTSDIKKLRDLTGAGFLDCKEALEQSSLNVDKAIDSAPGFGKGFGPLNHLVSFNLRNINV